MCSKFGSACGVADNGLEFKFCEPNSTSSSVRYILLRTMTIGMGMDLPVLLEAMAKLVGLVSYDHYY